MPAPRTVRWWIILLEAFALPAALGLILATAAGWLSGQNLTDSQWPFLAFVGWVCDVLSHLQIVYAFAFAIVLPLLILCRRWGVLVLSVPFAGSVALAVGPYLPIGVRTAEGVTGQTLTVAAFNFGGAIGRAGDIIAWVEREAPDVIVFSEGGTDLHDALRSLRPRFPFTLAVDNAGYENWIWSRFPLESAALPPLERGNNVIAARLCTDPARTRCLFVVGAHPASPVSADRVSSRNRTLSVMADVLAQHRHLPRIVAGDLNTTPWGASFRAMLERAELIDSALGRGLHPTWNVMDRSLLFPIDHVLHSREFGTLGRRVGPELGSDHFPVVARLAFR